jgi:hypothetical protein
MMEALLVDDVGIVFASYSDTMKWIDGLPEDQLEGVLRRLGGVPREGTELRHLVRSYAAGEFDDRSMTSTVVRTGTETIFDRDAKALRIVERVLGVIEQFSGGYRWETHQEEVQSAIWQSMDFARYASTMSSVEDFWSLVRAMDKSNDLDFPGYWDGETENALRDALHYEKVRDDGRSDHRCVQMRGFMTQAEYQDLVATEGPVVKAITRAATYHARTRRGTGPFSPEKARAHYAEFGTGFYFTSERSTGRSAPAPVVDKGWSKPISKGGDEISQVEYREFSRKEADAGYSVFGYWFAPDGTVHAMNDLQIHDVWIRKTVGGAPGFKHGRMEAYPAGWVSMTMMNDYNPAANISYGATAECSKALKAAARMIKRGGDFSSVVIEAYDQDYKSVSYEGHDDLRAAARRLNEIATGLRSNGPAMR